MSELEKNILEIMNSGIKKFDLFLNQISDEFFGLQESSKEELSKKFKNLWEANPYQTAKQLLDKIIPNILNDRTCPDGNVLKQILTIGFNSDFAKPELPMVPLFLGEITPDDFTGKTFAAKRPSEIN